jgi:prolyl oligopeptidase
MRLLARLAAAALAAALSSHAAAADTTAPATPRDPVTDTYHGVEVVDDYRWMEDMSSPQWKAWLKTQADHAEDVLARIPGRAALKQRLAELSDAGETVGQIERRGARVFYLKSEPGHDQRRLYVRERGAERLLLDPSALPSEAGHPTIDFHAPSPDGRLVALGLSAGGSEDSVLRVLDTSTGRFLPDTITRAGLNETVAWRPDRRSFLYNRLPPPGPDGKAERYNRSALYLHVLGRNPERDPAVFGWDVTPSRRFELADLPLPAIRPGSPWAVVAVLHGDAPERSYYVAPLAKVTGPGAPWRRVVGPQDQVRVAYAAGDRLYAVSVQGAPHGRVVMHDLRRPDGAARVVVPESSLVLRRGAVTADALVLEALDGGASRLLRVPFEGRPAPLPMPFEGSVRELRGDAQARDVWVDVEGWMHAPAVYRIGPDGQAADTGLQKPFGVDTSGYEARRVMVASADGTQVPLSIVAKKGLGLDGSHPAVLTGYGAYGISMEARFVPRSLAWLERGGVLAVAHVRGGGEFGAAWHNAARVPNGNKQNTVSDFIACAEYLIAEGYTAKGRIAGTGRSAGGLTIGGAITQRPDLFVAAQSGVGLSDLLRAETTSNGPPNIPEFGTVANPGHFRTMHALSPYHRVQDGVAYPAVIVTTGANDPRVEAWEPGKMAARLQAATASGRPVLLRVDFDAGHGIGSTRSQAVSEQADVWSFFLWQMGEPGFQPASTN